MDGLFYVDSKMPFNSASASSVTLAAAVKSLTPTAMIPVLGPSYFNFVGKAIRVRALGTLTTGATPGNLTLSWLWGTGADNVGTVIATSAVIWTANLTSNSWLMEMTFRCRALGTSGSLFGQGFATLQGTGTVHIPATASAPVAADLTATNYLSLQAGRSGSTAETMQLLDIYYEALN